METDEGDNAILKVRFARRGSVRAASVVGGVMLLGSPLIDDFLTRGATGPQLPHVVGAEMDAQHYELEWTRMTPQMRAECAEHDLAPALRAACAKLMKPAEHCDHECRTWGTELAAHVSFGF